METAPEVPTFEIRHIAKIVRTRDNGTWQPNVRNINTALQRSIPSVEFTVDSKAHDFKEIEQELARSKPVIPWLLIHEPGRDYEHTIVVTGYNRVNQQIAVNDPMPSRSNGPSLMNITQFIEEWEATERTLIKLKVNQRVQRMLTEWVEVKTRDMEVQKIAST